MSITRLFFVNTPYAENSLNSREVHHEKRKSAIIEKLLWAVVVIVILLVGALGLHMSLLLNQRMGPGGVTGRAAFVREIPIDSVLN